MDLEEYKRKKIRTVELPSGLVIKIRTISPFMALRIRKEYSKDGSEDLLTPEIIEGLFKTFIVSPRIPDELAMDDILPEDFRAILDAIIEQISFTKGEELKEVVETDRDFQH